MRIIINLSDISITSRVKKKNPTKQKLSWYNVSKVTFLSLISKANVFIQQRTGKEGSRPRKIQYS